MFGTIASELNNLYLYYINYMSNKNRTSKKQKKHPQKVRWNKNKKEKQRVRDRLKEYRENQQTIIDTINRENQYKTILDEMNEDEEKEFFDNLEQQTIQSGIPFAALKKGEGRDLDLTHHEIEMLNSILNDNELKYSTPLPSPKPNSSFDGIIDIPTPGPVTRAPEPLTPYIFDGYHPYDDMNFDFKSTRGGKRIIKKKSKRRTKKRGGNPFDMRSLRAALPPSVNWGENQSTYASGINHGYSPKLGRQDRPEYEPSQEIQAANYYNSTFPGRRGNEQWGEPTGTPANSPMPTGTFIQRRGGRRKTKKRRNKM